MPAVFADGGLSFAEISQLMQMIAQLGVVRTLRANRGFDLALRCGQRRCLGETLVVETTGGFLWEDGLGSVDDAVAGCRSFGQNARGGLLRGEHGDGGAAGRG